MDKVITVKQILAITKGKLLNGNEELVCGDFCKDTRQIKQGDVYVGIKGEHFDGSSLYEQALEKGARICLLQNIDITEEIKKKYPTQAIIKVENTITALQELAKYKRNLYQIPVIAVTGSVGKTSTKDMLASVIGKQYQVLKTMGNYNNHIGVPLTILGLKEHTALVIEMGMNNLGEIRLLTNIAKPTIAVITNIGTAHIGILGSRENILKAKLEILEGLQEKGTLVINNDNDLLYQWNSTNTTYPVATFGIDNPSDVMAKDILKEEYSSSFTIKTKQKDIAVTVPIGGTPFIYNALCAITVGQLLEIPMENILQGIATFELTKNRMEIVQHKTGATLIKDYYNANYDSMKAGIEFLANLEGKRKIAVLGDMLELGEFAQELHEKVGSEVVKHHIDVLITVGKESKNLAKKAKELGMSEQHIYAYDTTKQASDTLNKIMQKQDCILLKASNGMKFETIIEAIG